jgi:N-dimethylarginine dimethylaminohydrolase
VEYVINPWMEGNIHRASHELALGQWRSLHHLLEPHASIELAQLRRSVALAPINSVADRSNHSDEQVRRHFYRSFS